MEIEGQQMTSQYGAYALHAVLATLYALMFMHTPTRPGTHMHAHTHTHRPIASPRNNASNNKKGNVSITKHCLSCYKRPTFAMFTGSS
jgi:hypothetical protein